MARPLSETLLHIAVASGMLVIVALVSFGLGAFLADLLFTDSDLYRFQIFFLMPIGIGLYLYFFLYKVFHFSLKDLAVILVIGCTATFLVTRALILWIAGSIN